MILKGYAFFCMVVFFIESNGQKLDKDSLAACVEMAINSSEEPLPAAAREFSLRNEVSILSFLDLMVNASKSKGDSLEFVQKSIEKAVVLELLSRSNEAADLYDRLTQIARRNSFIPQLKIIYERVGIIYYNRARYDLALNAFSKYLTLLEIDKDENAISDLYLHLARLHHSLQDTTKTKEFLNKSFELKSKNKHNLNLEYLRFQQALTASDLGNHEEAFEHVNQAIQICSPQCSPYKFLLADFIKAKTLRKKGVSIEAEDLFLNAIRIARELQDNRHVSEALLNLSLMDIEKHFYGEAKNKLDEALIVSVKNEYNEVLLDIYATYIKVYSTLKNDDSLVFYQSKFIEQNDKVYSEEQLIKISSVQVDFETREDVNIIATQKELMEIQEKALTQKMYINIAIGFLAMMLIIIIAILYDINKKKRTFNANLDLMVHERTKELEEKQTELLNRTKELSLQRDVMYREMQARISTLQGLCYLAEHDKDANVSEDDLRLLREITKDLQNQLEKIKEFSALQHF
jgi:tetratricopeptide (TPR) repeat protein